MNFEPSAKQALFLFGVLFGQTPEEREPMQSKTRPEMTPQDRKALLDAGLIELTTRGRSKHVRATDGAWDWAGSHLAAELSSRSPAASPILHNVLVQLGSYLNARGLTLADLFVAPAAPQDDAASPEDDAAPTTLASDAPPARLPDEDSALRSRIRETVARLGAGRARQRVRLADLRRELSGVARHALDAALLGMQSEQQLVLYRLDNPAELRASDEEAALFIGEAPRHLVYLEG